MALDIKTESVTTRISGGIPGPLASHRTSNI